MSKKTRLRTAVVTGVDDTRITENRRDMSGGANSRLDAQDIGTEQAVTIQNVDIGTPGKRIKRPGLTEIDVLATMDEGLGITGFEPDGGTNALHAIFLSGTDTAVYQSNGAGFTAISGTTNIVDSGVSISFPVWKTGGDGQVMMYGSATKNWSEIDQADNVEDLGNDADDPPRSNVGCFFNGRMWVLSDNRLYPSDAYPTSTYSAAFNRGSEWYNMPCGEERFLIGIRGKGLICGGKDEIRYVQPSDTPDAGDTNGILVKDGCVANRSAVLLGDDIFYLAKDGVRGVFRTQYDTAQYKGSIPISYALKDEFDTINWAYIHLATAIAYDNKYFLSLPVNSSTYNNAVWVYYPASKGWMTITGWTVSDWATLQVNGADKLYATDGTSGEVYRAWFGGDDDGADIALEEKHRKEDIQKPFEEKRGGEVIVKAKATGSYTVNTYGSFDESEYTLLGQLTTLDLEVNFAAWNLPMEFSDAQIHTEKYHLDRYGPWYQLQLKHTHDGTGGNDLTILQHSILTHKDEYDSEEDA